MFFRASVSSLILAAALMAGPVLAVEAPAAPAGAKISVNGKPITDAELKAAETEMSEALGSVPEAQRRDQLIDYLITVDLLADEAKKEKLNTGPEFEQRRAFAEKKMLMDTLMRAEIAKQVTPQAIKAFYEERLKTVKPEQEVRARHILLPTEEEAKKAIAAINGGKKFEDVAKEMSKDPGSAKEGGDLGYFTKDRMVPEFSKAAFEAEPGKLLPNPVKSQFGWHVIKVEDKRTQPAPDMAAVEPQIRTFLTRKAQAELVEKLRKDAKIVKPEVKAEAPPVNPAAEIKPDTAPKN